MIVTFQSFLHMCFHKLLDQTETWLHQRIQIIKQNFKFAVKHSSSLFDFSTIKMLWAHETFHDKCRLRKITIKLSNNFFNKKHHNIF